jgi:hypothetical protein
MNPVVVQQFLTIPLPIMVTLVATMSMTQWSQNTRMDDLHKRIDHLREDNNKRFDELRADMNRRFDEVIRRLDRIEAKLENQDERTARLEERTSIVKR